MYLCMEWCLFGMSVRSGVLGVGVVMHVLRLLDEGCAGDGRGEYKLC